MRPVVTPSAMRAIDAASLVAVEELIERAGFAVAKTARAMMGGTYGRRVAVVVGKGNNGADGRVAARILRKEGVAAELFDAGDLDEPVARGSAGFDLLIDAAYGTGFRAASNRPFTWPFEGPDAGVPPVLAVDIPSGVDGLTGEVRGEPVRATRTITFVAIKPGLVLWPGAGLVGEVEVVDLGLEAEVGEPSCYLLDPSDLAGLWPSLPPDGHKWRSAVWVIGGGPGMTGAPLLAAMAAARSGAGMVLCSVPEADHLPETPLETVFRPLEGRWADEVAGVGGRVGAIVLGPGLPISAADQVRSVVASWSGPLVLDAGALDAVARAPQLLAGRPTPAVLTPHEGEFARLGGSTTGDRIETTRRMAAEYRAVVLLKGATTVVADPEGNVLLSNSGDQRLATAGSGDVLAGIIGAALAQGLPPLQAAGLGALLHGIAASRGRRVGLVASDLPPLIADSLSELGLSAPGFSERLRKR